MKVVKKDNTKEPFNVQKVVIAVNKSAFRALVKFTDEEIDFICRFVQDEARKMGKEEIEISEQQWEESTNRIPHMSDVAHYPYAVTKQMLTDAMRKLKERAGHEKHE